jgi:membrane-bound lytic murein transglycosylase D
VKKGEYPGKIARDYRVSLNEFLAWNGLSSRSTIRVGQKLKVQVAAKPEPQVVAAAVVTTEPRKHIVSRGESAWVIAQKHGVATNDLLKWNRLSTNSILREGDELVLDNPESDGHPAI